MRVIFYGTPGFAVPSLTALVGEGFDVAAVVTRPDKPAGRHRSRLEPPPVKRAAQAEDLMLFQPENPRTAEFQTMMEALAPDVAVVVGYGHILPEALLNTPRHGSVNVHASLLPKLRGAAPIERAIMEGLEETGVSIMRMDAGMDTGPVLHQARTPIGPEETGGDLRNRLAELGALALIEALTLLEEAGLEPQAQDELQATYAPKLSRADEKVDFSRSAAEVARQVRALDPVPGAYAEHRGRVLKLYGARVHGPGPGSPGSILSAGETLAIACGDGSIEVAEVQPEGKARMTVKAFANGRGIAAGDRLT